MDVVSSSQCSAAEAAALLTLASLPSLFPLPTLPLIALSPCSQFRLLQQENGDIATSDTSHDTESPSKDDFKTARWMISA
jgi:hypothetical protein